MNRNLRKPFFHLDGEYMQYKEDVREYDTMLQLDSTLNAFDAPTQAGPDLLAVNNAAAIPYHMAAPRTLSTAQATCLVADNRTSRIPPDVVLTLLEGGMTVER